jgi:DNA-binding MarR family transcriptional regulator
MVASLPKRVVPAATLRAGRYAVWFSRISRTLAQQMLLYARRELGLNLAEYRALSMLSECRSASIKDIAAGTHLDKAQVIRAIAGLTRRGLAVHTVDGRDRRLRVVKLTTAGQALAARSIPFAVERQGRMEQALPSAERRALWNALMILSQETQAMLTEEAQKPRRRRRGRMDSNV